jgi:hypothetical protein
MSELRFMHQVVVLTLLVLIGQVMPVSAHEQPIFDIVVYGDSSSAVTAAVAAKRNGRSVILINPVGFLGGMSASGLGATDFGSGRSVIGGIASEFYEAIARAYGKSFVRSFEPHVGQAVFDQLITNANVPVVFNEKLDRHDGVTFEGNRITSIRTLSGKTYRGKMFIDATYVGDLMAAAGVTYTVGREPESQYGEDLAGVRRGDTNPRIHYTQGDKDHFISDVDPFIKPGEPDSGLLPYVFQFEHLVNGEGDGKIQAFNYRVCLTTDPGLRIPIRKPEDYREIDHELLLRNFEAGDHRLPALIEPLAGTGSKVDWNTKHAVGSDYAGANWEYPEASYQRRRDMERAHETYIRGFLWTLANHPRVPPEIRDDVSAFGLSKDEFTDNGGWPYMIYIREARRMVSDYVMTQLNCMHRRIAEDPVAFGAFGMDSHVVQYFVNEHGFVRRDGVIWRVPPRPYGISYRSIVPREGECENLFSPVCLSASHVAHGSIRMEPVFMVLGQSAATAAGLAIDKRVSVQNVDYADLRRRLIAGKLVVQVDDQRQYRSPEELSGIVMDDTQAQKTGVWQHSTFSAGYVGDSYLHDGNSERSDHRIRFEVSLPSRGRYEVRMAYTPHSNRATNVSVVVKHASGETRYCVDQTKADNSTDGFHLLGTFLFQEDKPAVVEISNEDANGYVVADAVQFIPVQ